MTILGCSFTWWPKAIFLLLYNNHISDQIYVDFSAENGRKFPVVAANARCNTLSAITEYPETVSIDTRETTCDHSLKELPLIPRETACEDSLHHLPLKHSQCYNRSFFTLTRPLADKTWSHDNCIPAENSKTDCDITWCLHWFCGVCGTTSCGQFVNTRRNNMWP